MLYTDAISPKLINFVKEDAKFANIEHYILLARFELHESLLNTENGAVSNNQDISIYNLRKVIDKLSKDLKSCCKIIMRGNKFGNLRNLEEELLAIQQILDDSDFFKDVLSINIDELHAVITNTLKFISNYQTSEGKQELIGTVFKNIQNIVADRSLTMIINDELEMLCTNQSHNPLVKYTYQISDGVFDHSVGCIVTLPSGLTEKSDIECELHTSVEFMSSLNATDEIMSNIIKLTVNVNLPVESIYTFALPYLVKRNPAKKLIIKHYLDFKWTEYECSEIKWNDVYLMECHLATLSGLFVVVSQPKIEVFNVGKGMGKFISHVDSRIMIAGSHGCLKIKLPASLQVQLIATEFLSDLKIFAPNIADEILAISPVITFVCDKRNLFQPINFTVPLPLSFASRQALLTKRSALDTAAAPNVEDNHTKNACMDGTGKRKCVLNSFQKWLQNPTEADNELTNEEIYLVRQFAGRWLVWPATPLEASRNSELVSFAINTTEPFRAMIFRTKGEQSEENILKIGEAIEQGLNKRICKIILGQLSSQPKTFILQNIVSNRLRRTISNMLKEGHKKDTICYSKDVILSEHQSITITLRGNITFASAAVKSMTNLFNSQLKSQLKFQVVEVDKHAQDCMDNYSGYLQMSTMGIVKQLVQNKDKKGEGGFDKKKHEMVMMEILLGELVISIPRGNVFTLRPINREKFIYETNDDATEEFMQDLSFNLGSEWKILAAALGIKKQKLQTIISNNIGREENEVVYDMLLTWVKRTSTQTPRAKILMKALCDVGRENLAVDLLRDISITK